jgi:hypothetical protein
VRVQTDIDRRASALSVEALQAREREQGVRVELAEAHARLAGLDARVRAFEERTKELDAAAQGALERERSLREQRRVRLALALGRPLDAVRRLFR